MAEIKILYTGWVGSGKTTSLKVISRKAKPPFNYEEENFSGWKFLWNKANLLYSLHVSKTMARCINREISIKELYHNPIFKLEAEFLRQTDGIIFIAYSQKKLLHLNEYFLERTKKELIELKRNPSDIPIVFQLNHNDYNDIADIEVIKKNLIWPECAFVETVATTEQGIVEALNLLIDLVVQKRRN